MQPRGGGGGRRLALPALPGVPPRRERPEKTRLIPLHVLVLALLLVLAALCTPSADAIVTPDAPASVPAPTDGSSSGVGPKAATAPSPAPTAVTSRPTNGAGPTASKRDVADPKPDHQTATKPATDVRAAAVAPANSEEKDNSDRAEVGQLEADKQAATASSLSSGSGAADNPSAPTPATPSSPSAASPAKPQRVTEVYVEARPSRGMGEAEDEFESIDIPLGLFEVVDGDNAGRRQNYASLDAGATILDSSADTKSPTSLLVPDKDRYMMTPCQNPQKWVVVSLSEDVQADAIVIANYEKFSSPVKDFLVLGSINYPTDTWLVLGNFTAEYRNGEQVFPLELYQHVRYIKLRFYSHYGSEYYCTLSQLKVHGRTFTQVISQLEKTIDAEVMMDGASTITAAPATDQPLLAAGDGSGSGADEEDGSVALPEGGSEQEAGEDDRQPVCQPQDSAETMNPLAIYGDDLYGLRFAMCMPNDVPPDVKRPDKRDDSSAESSPDADEESDSMSSRADAGSELPAAAAAAPSSVSNPSIGPAASSAQSSTPTVTANATKGLSPGADTLTSGGSQVKSNTSAATSTSTTSVPAPIASSSGASINTVTQAVVGTTAVSSTQSLGRLENIFVRITKKIQALEVNQSGIARHVEEFQLTATLLQAHQEGLASQLHDIQTMLNDLSTRVTQEFNRNELLLDQVRRDNIALWNEMMMVRGVITTMKAGILCALILSAFIIAFYLLRLLLRCVARCKERADLREWFWRTESEELRAGGSNGANAKAAGSKQRGKSAPDTPDLRVNRKQQFGKSWDDSAIERKTLYREVVDGPRRAIRTPVTTSSSTADKGTAGSNSGTVNGVSIGGNTHRRHHTGRAGKKARTSSLNFPASSARVAAPVK